MSHKSMTGSELNKIHLVFLKKLLCLLACWIFISLSQLHNSIADDSDKYDWMTQNQEQLKSFFAPLEVPEHLNFAIGRVALDVTNSGNWVATGLNVKKDKLLKFDWSTLGASSRPRKYVVIFRIDPRFQLPEIFIKTYNYLLGKYQVSNFPSFLSNDPTKDFGILSFTKMKDYVDYFNLAMNDIGINVARGDVVNITLASSADFFNVSTDSNILTKELETSSFSPSFLYTNTNGINNKIIYSSAYKICDLIDPDRASICYIPGCTPRSCELAYNHVSPGFNENILKYNFNKTNNIGTFIWGQDPKGNFANKPSTSLSTGLYSSTIEIDISDINNISDFQLKEISYDDYLLIEVNGQKVLSGPDKFSNIKYVANRYSDENLFVVYNYNSERKLFFDMRNAMWQNNDRSDSFITDSEPKDIGGWRYYYKLGFHTDFDQGTYKGPRTASGIKNSKNVSLLGYLVQGKNTIKFTVGVAGTIGGLYYNASYKLKNCIFPPLAPECLDPKNARYNPTHKETLVGRPFLESQVAKFNQDLSSCTSVLDDPNVNPLCFYDQGVGMKITIGKTVIKDQKTPFVKSDNSKKTFLYYKSPLDGKLTFTTDWLFNDMFMKLNPQMMKDWINKFASVEDLQKYLTLPESDLAARYVHAGRYIMNLEIGNGDKILSYEQQKKLKVEYLIVDAKANGAPPSSLNGTLVDQNAAFNADKDGYLWMRIINPSTELEGNITVEYLNYTGSTWFSDIVYIGVVKPLHDQFQTLTRNFYSKFSTNASFLTIAQGSLALYIVIFGMMFLIGAVQTTTKEFVTRIMKIAIVTLLISENSWEFFNGYLFELFTSGTDELMRNVVGISSSTTNIFGFIDPIFDRYTNPRVWGLLFIQLLQIHNGLFLIALMSIYSLLLYFRGILEVIIGYVIAFVVLSVMIGLAPLFIVFILFDQTKSLFDNWLSTLFNYMIQPTILLVFFLLIDQVISEQLLKVLVKAHWDTLVKIKVGLDLNHMYLPLDFSFALPFLPGIPFYVPEVSDINNIDDLKNGTGTFLVLFSASLLFYSYCLMAYGLVDYVTKVVSQLTNVQAPNPTSEIMSDMNKAAEPAKNIASKPLSLFKSKIIDQNYSAKDASGGGAKRYGNKIFESRADGKSPAADKDKDTKSSDDGK